MLHLCRKYLRMPDMTSKINIDELAEKMQEHPVTPHGMMRQQGATTSFDSYDRLPEIKVPTLDGHVDVKVPAGSQPDEVLRLKGKGLPVFGAPMRGDMNIRLRVNIPKKPTKEEKDLYRKLREKSGKARNHWWK